MLNATAVRGAGGIGDRSCLDGWLHVRRGIQSGAHQMVILERGWRREGIRLGNKSRLEQ